MAELILSPMFRRASLKVFEAHACAFQRELFARAPLKGGFKHTYVDCSPQLLHPGVTSLGSRSGDGIMEWHLDGIAKADDKPSAFHAICTPCTASTEFNTQPRTVDCPDGASVNQLNRHLSLHGDAMGLLGRRMPAAQFVTWGTHVHRSTRPERVEFRFFFRITESDLLAPMSDAESLSHLSVVHGLGEGWPAHISIEQRSDGILLHKTW